MVDFFGVTSLCLQIEHKWQLVTSSMAAALQRIETHEKNDHAKNVVMMVISSAGS
jgi:hypothetical protein